jgi:uncharacterized flavoprotein (TIGR03862 family)
VPSSPPCIIVGAGPTGLIAAERLASAGRKVVVYDRKPSVGRKFLMAGRGGLNLTHSEPLEKFLTRYGTAQEHLASAIKNFPPEKLIEWANDLGQETFTGSSGRIFPKVMKASPLLRAWLARLEKLGVEFKLRQTWKGWDKNGDLLFNDETVKPAATLLALGGASWPGLGSDGSWANILAAKNIPLAPLRPSNCGFIVNWSDILRNKFAGTPLKNIALTFEGKIIPGEIMISRNGIEGGAIYAISAALRDNIEKHGDATFTIDLRPGLSHEHLTEKLSSPHRRKSFSTYMQTDINMPPAAVSLLREINRDVQTLDPSALAALIKSLPIRITAPFAIDRAISSAGGIKFGALDKNFMLKSMPGTFAAGEMLDWEAPTGGYLLQACFATGQAAAHGILSYLRLK